ncbi:CocE/NonD family hydrolase [Ruegeria sp. EL01]|uniref:CocE/NonD family hydrolase n=1 Tax=Ruegeria sp. EL01 TaxID=2107578 RepID=UPI000EA7FE58|nr:CocE/NonD family hydrolase [Ruegeria sp. EL01]
MRSSALFEEKLGSPKKSAEALRQDGTAPSLAEAELKEIQIIEHVWIKMSDGVRLSAKIWLPVDAADIPVPAVLEIIPYRKRDSYAIRDHRNHAWMAARGYACIRPDMRGHGDSEGIMLDEYSLREQQDTIEVIEWLSKQSWCSGEVGMMGLSWGGIASMQAAVKQPPALKAIIPVGASVDRYYADGGYLVGGYAGQGLGWGGVMFGYCVRPPDPAVVGDVWRDMWFERLEQTPMFAEKWLTHQLRDETWKQGSVCEDYDKIEVPVLGVSGWNDCWPNTMIRLLENIEAPCKVVSGPWGHVFPNLGGPGPMAGFLQLALAWWDYWLKGIDTGVMENPAFLAYLQESHAPNPNPTDRPGRWIGETSWPSKNVSVHTFGMIPGQLSEDKGASSDIVEICSPVTLGLKTGEYMPISGVAELAQDQSADDALSVCFDSEPLKDRFDILGTTNVNLRISSDCSHGMVAARICDVAPDGKSTLISYGLLNLKQREGLERCTEITPDEMMEVSVRLNDTGWSIKPGHRLRLALSSHLWPMAWPQAEQATLKLNLASCSLNLPVRHPEADSLIHSPLAEPEAADPPTHEIAAPSQGSRHVNYDIQSGQTVYDVQFDGGKIRFDAIDLTYGSTNTQRYTITEGDPLSAKIEYSADFSFAREGWDVRTESRLVTTCDADNFILNGSVAAFEGENQVFTRTWDIKIPRVVF